MSPGEIARPLHPTPQRSGQWATPAQRAASAPRAAIDGKIGVITWIFSDLALPSVSYYSLMQASTIESTKSLRRQA